MGRREEKILENIGCDVDVMWRRKPEERFTSGTEVRKRICEGRPWKDLVPEYVYKYTLDHKLDVRICEINK